MGFTRQKHSARMWSNDADHHDWKYKNSAFDFGEFWNLTKGNYHLLFQDSSHKIGIGEINENFNYKIKLSGLSSYQHNENTVSAAVLMIDSLHTGENEDWAQSLIGVVSVLNIFLQISLYFSLVWLLLFALQFCWFSFMSLVFCVVENVVKAHLKHST